MFPRVRKLLDLRQRSRYRKGFVSGYRFRLGGSSYSPSPVADKTFQRTLKSRLTANDVLIVD